LYDFISFLEKGIGYNNGVSRRRRSMIESIMKQTPVVGTAYGLVKTSLRVYNASTLVNALCEAAKGVLIDCSPPVIKYPLLWAYLLVSGTVTVASGGNPLAVSGTLNAIRLIIEEG
jgi:hypothetical protein